MTADEASGPRATAELPEPVQEWLSRIAAERGVPEEELLAWLLPPADAPDPADADDLGAAIDARAADRIEERIAALEDRLDRRIDDAEADFDEKLADVRERVVQVKRETDAKAPADHGHADLAADLEAAIDELEELRATVEAVDERTAAGFENYQSVLDYLTEATDDLDGKLTTLASAVLDARDRVDAIVEAHARRAAADELARAANEQGITGARCESCEERVEIGLLRTPRCPHCRASFSEVEPRRSFFGHHTLRTGTPPTLESSGGGGADLDSILGDDDAAEGARGEAFGEGPSRVDSIGGRPADGSTDDDGRPTSPSG